MKNTKPPKPAIHREIVLRDSQTILLQNNSKKAAWQSHEQLLRFNTQDARTETHTSIPGQTRDGEAQTGSDRKCPEDRT